MPLIGPSTLLPQRTLPLNRYVFYLLPGLNERGAHPWINCSAKESRIPESRELPLSVLMPSLAGQSRCER